MTAILRRELELLLAWLVLLLVLGSFIGHLLVVLLLGLSAYIIWTLYNLHKLTRWLSKPSKHAPESWGVWDEVYFQLNHLYQRQRKARRKLTSILNRFQKSTQALPYATIVLNHLDEIEWFNAAASQLFNLYSKVDVGQRIDNLIRHPEFIRYIAKRQFDKPLEFSHETKKLLLNITPYGTGQYLLSARDVTQRRRLDDMRRDFISNASHELRTPITVMSGYIEVLMDTQDKALQAPLKKIQQQTARMESIVIELIGLAKLETSAEIENPVPIDVRALFDDIYNEAIGFDQGKHNISVSYEDVELSGNYDELRMAISNLMTNAIRYTPEGGAINLFSKLDNSGTCICVQDNGIGIEFQHISRLTERFYRVDEGRSRQQGGTGLGLAIVQQVLERHGGVLRIDTTPNKGSLFCCCFQGYSDQV